MKRILVISWFFPPINSSEGLVTYKLLNNSKLKYDVYTQKNNNLWSYINTEELKINKNINPIYSNSITLEEYVENQAFVSNVKSSLIVKGSEENKSTFNIEEVEESIKLNSSNIKNRKINATTSSEKE